MPPETRVILGWGLTPVKHHTPSPMMFALRGGCEAPPICSRTGVQICGRTWTDA